MSTVIDVEEAEELFFELVERAHRGEEIIFAKAGQPCAKLLPIDEEPSRSAPID